MRTNIEIDDELLEEARRILGCRTKKETVTESLRRILWQAQVADLEAARAEGLMEPGYDHRAMRLDE